MILIIKRYSGTVYMKEIHELSVDSLYADVSHILNIDTLEFDILTRDTFTNILDTGNVEEETTYMLQELLDDWDEEEEELVAFDKITGYIIVTNKLITINTYDEFELT